MRAKTAPTVLLVGVLLAIGAIAMDKWPFGPWRRTSDGPILSPQGSGWESAGTFNPAVVEYNGKFVMLYRAQDAAGELGVGDPESTGGINFNRPAGPGVWPEAGHGKNGGVGEPRLQSFGKT